MFYSIGDCRLLTWTEDPRNEWSALYDLVSQLLGDTPHDEDAERSVLSLFSETADETKEFFRRFLAHRTGVDDEQVSLIGGERWVPPSANQESVDSFRVVPIHLASECVDIKRACHTNVERKKKGGTLKEAIRIAADEVNELWAKKESLSQTIDGSRPIEEGTIVVIIGSRICYTVAD